MRRNRRTQRRISRRKPTASRSLLAEINALEARLAVDETQIDNWGDELAREESKIVDEGSGSWMEEEEDQNELAMDNWDDADMTASEKEMVAERLVKMANYLLGER
jgi:hypothetical protein